MSKVQLRRLVKIDKIIAEKRPGGENKYPNCTTLAKACEVCTKTIQRDLAFMIDESHAPIAYDKTNRGYYYTEPSYRFPAISITQGDLFAIFVAEKALMQYENTPLYEKLVPIFQQIAQALPDKVSINPSWVDSKFSFFPKPAARMKPGVWDAVAEALRRSRTLEVRHRVPGYDETMPRRLDPYHVVGYGGEWYVIGYCHYREEIRTFAMSRIQEACVLQEEPFSVPKDFDVKKLTGLHFGIIWGDQDYRVRIEFAADQAPYVKEREWHPTQTIKESKDGSIILSFKTNHLFEVKRWVLSWGARAKVLGPKELRDDIKREVQSALALYK